MTRQDAGGHGNRLFIALLFDEETKDRLCGAMKYLAAHMRGGHTTGRGNLHLTLAFLGETNRASEVRRAMEEAAGSAFDYQIKGSGRFSRGDESIFWAGIAAPEELYRLYDRLSGALASHGFRLEERPFKPHLTLGREVVTDGTFDPKEMENFLPEKPLHAGRISLMKSERIAGKLTYTEVYSVHLEEKES
ncbi:MAG TPA: RNA 2',3'-cyclic phosphodiesterase [Oscillospiraceae bacterium]|nr:RNA 2',3'-cyclic phosphodiesterase [Oscillospiraceae bacterium]HXK77528.1 RNA 2',3'-cyclic phosphodiesterase [Oscillospiraceae bacterium]